MNKLGKMLATGLLAVVAGCGQEPNKGTYQGFEAQAFYEGPMRRVILGYERNSPPSRIIGTDHPYMAGRNGEVFESIETLYLPENDPLSKLATSEHMEKAWKQVYKEVK